MSAFLTLSILVLDRMFPSPNFRSHVPLWLTFLPAMAIGLTAMLWSMLPLRMRLAVADRLRRNPWNLRYKEQFGCGCFMAAIGCQLMMICLEAIIRDWRKSQPAFWLLLCVVAGGTILAFLAMSPAVRLTCKECGRRSDILVFRDLGLVDGYSGFGQCPECRRILCSNCYVQGACEGRPGVLVVVNLCPRCRRILEPPKVG